jgi:transcription elongation factor
MKERGKYQIQCMKSRSSTGVGQKIDLEYNIETMRITDPGIEQSDNFRGGPKPSIMDAIKAKANVSSADATEDGSTAPKWERAQGTPAWEKPLATSDGGKVTADVQSAKLKQLLGKIKTG